MLESILLVISLCVDACVASFAYGTNKIKIPFTSNLVLSGISTLFLAISLGFGSLISRFIPADLTQLFCFAALFTLGFMRFFEGILKNYLNKKALSPNHIEVNLFDFKLVMNVYADATLADLDHSKSLSVKEALYLGIALSLDSLIVGLGAGLAPVAFTQVIPCSILFNLLAICIGCLIGNKCAEKINIDLSWLSGIIIIFLSFLKL